MLLFLVGFPIIWGIVCGIASRVWGKNNRKLCNIVLGAGALTELAVAVHCLSSVVLDRAAQETVYLPGFCGMGIGFALDGFRAVYVVIAVFMWTVSILFSQEYMDNYPDRGRYDFFLVVTMGATVGVFLAGDLFTLFVCFEVMSLASYSWVAQDEKRESLKAGSTYLAVAVIGGLVMLMGLMLLYYWAGTLDMGGLPEQVMHMSTGQKWAVGLCLLFGFGAKAGAVPLHIWLPKAHPVAPAPASALLSGILTKTGILGILYISMSVFKGTDAWGSLILVIGLATMITGAVLALLSVNLKRTLACSSVSQIGFLLVGIGMGVLLGEENGIAMKGTFLHMVNHSLIKLVLFCAAGVVFMNVHKLDLNEIRGFGREKKLLAGVFLTGAMSLSGIPLGSGYVSKTLLHEGIVEYAVRMGELAAAGLMKTGALGVPGLSADGAVVLLKLVEWIFLICGGLTFAYMLKIFIAVFVERNQDARVQDKFDRMKEYWKPLSRTVLCIAAGVILAMGLLPGILMDGLADTAGGFLGAENGFVRGKYFSLGNLGGALISLLIGGFVYKMAVRRFLMKNGRYVDIWKPGLDLEERVYRPFLLVICNMAFSAVFRFCDRLLDYAVVGLRRSVLRDSPLPHELEEGTYVTHIMGMMMDDGKEFLNRTLLKKRPLKISFEHKLAMVISVLDENSRIITRSLSFGLLLFCIGLIATLLYLLV